MQRDIQERTFNFGVRIIKLVGSLPNSKIGGVIRNIYWRKRRGS